MNKSAVIIASIVLITGLTAAFETNQFEIDDRAELDNPAEFNVEIDNTEASDKSFRVHIHDYHRSQWYSYDDDIDVEAGEKENASITVSPGDDAIGQRYGFDYSITDKETGESVREGLSYRVIRDNDLNLVDLELSEAAPGETLKAEMTFQNTDESTTGTEKVSLQALGESKEIELNPIVPGGERNADAEFEIPEYESPGNKTLNLSFDGQDRSEAFEIDTVEQIDTEEHKENKILTTSKTAEVSNNGNTPRNYTYTLETPSYLSPITTAEGAEIEEDGSNSKYNWALELEPGESETVEVRTDYWLPVTGLALLLGGLLTLKKLTSNVSVTKKVTRTSEGLDLEIEIENNTSRMFNDVLLEDFIPNIAEIDSSFEMAAPEVKRTDQGTKLKWWITELEPGDQRILKYSVRPKVEVEGGVTLKSAVLKDGDKVIGKTRELETEFKPSE